MKTMLAGVDTPVLASANTLKRPVYFSGYGNGEKIS